MKATPRNIEDSASGNSSSSSSSTMPYSSACSASSTNMRTRIPPVRSSCQLWLVAAACLVATASSSSSSSSSAYHPRGYAPKSAAFGMGSDDSFFISSASVLPRASSPPTRPLPQRSYPDPNEDEEEETEDSAVVDDNVDSYRAMKQVRRSVQQRKPRALDAPPPPAPASDSSVQAADDEVAVEEGYKARADWWKDPLAFFEDEEDEDVDGSRSSSMADLASDVSNLDEDEEDAYYEDEEDDERPGLRQRTAQRKVDEQKVEVDSDDEEEEAEPEVVGDYFDALEELRLPALPAEEEEDGVEPAPVEEDEGEEVVDEERRDLTRERRDSRAATTPVAKAYKPRKVAKAAVAAGSAHHRAAAVSDVKAKTHTTTRRRGASSARKEATHVSATPASTIDVGGSVAVTAVPAVGLVARFLPLPVADFFANQSGIFQAIGAILIVKQVVQSLWPLAFRRRQSRAWGESTVATAHVQAAPHSRGGGGVTRTSKRRAKGRGKATAEDSADETAHAQPRSHDKNRDDEINLDDESHESIEPALSSVDHDAFTDVEDEEDDFSYNEGAAESDSIATTRNEESKRASEGIISDPGVTSPSYRVDSSAKGGGLVANAFRRVVFGMQPPPPQHLLDQVQELTDRCIQLDRLKGAAEGEYERVNLQLQQAQSELASLKQTTRYLQAQLRDNEETMERVVKSERRKAKAELARMKESMLQIVEREREAMREEFQKQAEELERMLLKEQEQHLQQRPFSTSTVKSTPEANFTGAAVYHG